MRARRWCIATRPSATRRARRWAAIVPQTTIVGEQPVPVLVTSLEGFELRATYDAETNLRLLQPQGTGDHGHA